ncbi:hypothetical protein BKA62DRAFT_711673 [Auriculariales sp. MPI-PUGE-AT-0066]|nr:hypothetical protein BKA62DRAFT_711673 [Auriculariales sp. MPI-PUGE-AT-0066]
MPPAEAIKRPKRARKRKRRQAESSSESSSSSDSSSENEAGPSKASATVTKTAAPAPPAVPVEESSSESSSDDTSSDEEMLDERPEATTKSGPSRSPSPIRGDLPPFLPTDHRISEEERQRHDVELRERFKKFWMGSVAEAFKDDLVTLQKEPTLTAAKLAVLIDSLGAGAEIFSTKRNPSDIDEMELVLEDKST